MRLIDADALSNAMYRKSFETDDGRQRWDGGLWIRYKVFEEARDEATTVEAVPVVRCMDCKYRKVSEYHYKGIRYCVTECTIGNEGVIEACVDSGYCSLAEQKEKRNETD